MKVGDAGSRQPRGDRIANGAQLGRRDRELGRDDHRDANLGSIERALGRRDPVGERGRAPHDRDLELAAGPGRPRPRAQRVGLDDLDEVALEDAVHFRGLCGLGHRSNHRRHLVSLIVK